MCRMAGDQDRPGAVRRRIGTVNYTGANYPGNESNIRELTVAEVAAVSGASYALYPAPTAPALYSDQVFLTQVRTGSLF
jgi:hypothetical protein